MGEKVVHLFAGEQNDDGTVTVTSVISLCCRVGFPNGLGTVNPDAVTCPGVPQEGNKR